MIFFVIPRGLPDANEDEDWSEGYRSVSEFVLESARLKVENFNRR
jgi:hypothetical protein